MTDGVGGDLFELDLVVANRRVDVEKDGPGVLAQRQRVLAGEADVAADDVQGHVGVRSLRLVFARCSNGANDIVGELGGGAANQLENGLKQRGLRRDVANGSCRSHGVEESIKALAA